MCGRRISIPRGAADKIAALLDDHRFDLAAAAAYEFVWNTFCDWYLEFTKPARDAEGVVLPVSADKQAEAQETRATTAWALGQILHILHPFMPFITEELWAQFTGSEAMLITARWPAIKAQAENKDAQDEINWLVRGVSAIRTVRSELNVPAGAQIPLQVKGASAQTRARFETHRGIIGRLARLSGIAFVETVEKGSAQTLLDEATLVLPLVGIIDIEQESVRLKKEAEKMSAEIRKIESKLGNKDFVDRAPPEVVEEQRERKAEAEAALVKLTAAQKNLAA